MVYEDSALEEAVLRHQCCCTDVSLGADFYGVPLDFADCLFLCRHCLFVTFSWDYCLNFEDVEYFTFFPFLAHTSSFYLNHGILLSWCSLKGDTPPHSLLQDNANPGFRGANSHLLDLFQDGQCVRDNYLSL
jgi:hypothetical protein